MLPGQRCPGGWQKRGVVQRPHGVGICLPRVFTYTETRNKSKVRKTGAGPDTASTSPALGWCSWQGGHWGHLPHATEVRSGAAARGRQRSRRVCRLLGSLSTNAGLDFNSCWGFFPMEFSRLT